MVVAVPSAIVGFRKFMSRRAIVIGGAGFIGSHVVAKLLQHGDEVEVVDNLLAGKRERIPEQVKLHVVDIRDKDALAQAISHADVIFHLAALPSVQHSIDDPLLTHEVNTIGTLNVLALAKELGVKRVVYSGSSAAYGETEALPQHEDLREKPVHPYGLQKYIGEEYMRIFHRIHGLSTVTLRYFNVYGPGMDPHGAYAAVIGRFLEMRKKGEPLTITGDGEQTRDFVHVEDVARANLLASLSDRVGKGEVINIGSGIGMSMNQLADIIGGERTYVPARSEAKHSRADITRAKTLLDWEPTHLPVNGIGILREDWDL